VRTLLIIADSLEGGIGALVRVQATWFTNRGWRTRIIGGANDEATFPGAARAHVPLSARRVGEMLSARRALRGIFAREEPDVVHCHGLRGAALAMMAGVRPIVSLHGAGSLPGESFMYRTGRRSWLLACGLASRKAFSIAPFDGLLGRVWTFQPSASPRLENLERLPFPETPPLFVWIGRLAMPRRADLFIEAVTAAARDCALSAVVVGGGPQLPQLRALASRLEAPVTFVGEVGDVRPWLEQAWALVLLSRFEGMPLVLQEAMWVGRPVVASDLPGTRWLVGDAGYLVGDLAETSRALSELCDPAHARSLAEQAAVRVRARIGPEMPWSEVARFYDAATTQAPR
jgi:glycosyltransferase involved in cell wall biosynthesis